MGKITAYKYNKKEQTVTRLRQEDWDKEYKQESEKKGYETWKIFDETLIKNGIKYKEDIIYKTIPTKDNNIKIYFGKNLTNSIVCEIIGIENKEIKKEKVEMNKTKEYTKEELFTMAKEYNAIKTQLAELKKVEETYKKALMLNCLDGEILENKGKMLGVAIVKGQNNKMIPDEEKMKADGIYDKYLKQGEQTVSVLVEEM